MNTSGNVGGGGDDAIVSSGFVDDVGDDGDVADGGLVGDVGDDAADMLALPGTDSNGDTLELDGGDNAGDTFNIDDEVLSVSFAEVSVRITCDFLPRPLANTVDCTPVDDATAPVAAVVDDGDVGVLPDPDRPRPGADPARDFFAVLVIFVLALLCFAVDVDAPVGLVLLVPLPDEVDDDDPL
jgi:hypothetical protein